MKSYTDIEQSRKLAKILSLETADMTYCAITEGMREKMLIKDWQVNIGLDVAIKENLFSYRNGYMFPCWSLSALLSVLPQLVRLVGTSKDSYWYCECVNDNNQWYAGFGSADNPVDACYKMILKLNEQNLL